MVIKIKDHHILADRSRILAVLLLSVIQTLHAMPYSESREGGLPAPYQPALGRHPSAEENYRQSGGYGDPASTAGFLERGQGYQSNKAGGAYEGKGDGVKSGKGKKGEEDEQTETKYYYGGKFTGSCTVDGLYYRDDSTFVICSNGYPHAQPCPPGTRTAGYPRYKAGYYYGYTDLCSVNLVDFGYGPEYYAPKGYPKEDKDKEDEKKGEKRVGNQRTPYSSSSATYQHDVRQEVGRYDSYSRPGNDYGTIGRGYGVGQQRRGEREGKVAENHYSSHLGPNKQGGAEYGEAKGADSYPEYAAAFPGPERGYNRGNSGPPDRSNYRSE